MNTPMIHSKEFIAYLENLGVIPHRTRRVIIDADANKTIIKVYVEMYGDEGILKLEGLPFSEFNVEVVRSNE